MNYSNFISDFQKELSENGVRLSQDKIKRIFETLGDFVVNNIEYEEDIPLREFIVFRLVTIPPKRLPNGNMTEQQYSIKIEMTDKYKKRLKEQLNNK